jgi:hypothetical protein
MPDESGKCSLPDFKAFFETGGPKVVAAEVMALKKDPITKELSDDYDQIAIGIGNGSLNYEPTEAQKEAARAKDIHADLRV